MVWMLRPPCSLWLILLQVYFALSSEDRFSESFGPAKRFSNRRFYDSLIETVGSWPDDDRHALLL